MKFPPVSSSEVKPLQDKVKALEGKIKAKDQRIIAAKLGIHYNTVRNYLYGFGSDERILNGIISYAAKNVGR